MNKLNLYDNVTITIFVDPNSVLHLLTSLKILDDLDIENNYTLQPHDIEYTTMLIINYTQINIPIELYLKFKECYLRS